MSSTIKKTAGITLTFDLNGGNYAQSSKLEKLVYKDKAVGELPIPNKVGEEFIGWYTAKTDGTQITKDSTVSKNTTLYARWKTQDKSYDVQFLPNGGAGKMDVQNFLVDVAGKLSQNAFVKEDHIFTGWNTSADGSGTAYTDGQTVKNLTTKDKTVVSLYAQWKPVEKTYTIEYNANGGVGTMPVTKLTVGTAGNLSPLAFKRDSFTFAGWNTKADGSGETYTDKQEVKDLTTEDNAVITLYAQWKEMTEAEYLQLCTEYPSNMRLTVTRSGDLMPRPVLQGSVRRSLTTGETLTSTALYRNPAGEYWYLMRADRDGSVGYVYAGDVRNDGIADTRVTFRVSLAQTEILQGATCDISGSVTAENDILYEVTGKLNDEDPNTPEQTAVTYSGFDYLIGTAINNLSFGWLNRGKGTLVLTAKLRSACSTGTDLQWEEFTTDPHTVEFTILGSHLVTYDKNTTDEVENMPAAQKKTDKKDLTLAKEIPVRAGYTFLGWATKADALEAEYQPEAVYREDEDLKLYALWQQDAVSAYPVTYDKNTTDEVASMPTEQEKTDKQDLTLAAEIPTRAGYTFLGWATAADAAQAQYQPGDLYTEDAPLTLYALWQADAPGDSQSYTVTFTTDKPFDYMPESQTKLHGEALILSDAVPWSQYYAFKGWETEVDGERLVFQPGDTFTLDRSVTLTAIWEVQYYLYDAVNNTYWELGESFRQVDAFDTSEMCHITLGVNYSQEVLDQNPFGDWWLAIEDLTSWDTLTVGTRDGKLDFYVSPGTWFSIIGNINCDYTFHQSEDITVNAQMVVRHENRGILDPEAECSYSLYWVGYPQFGEVFPAITREGYTLMGWNTDPTSSEVIYAPDATWEQLDPAHVHCYAVWQQNT